MLVRQSNELNIVQLKFFKETVMSVELIDRMDEVVAWQGIKHPDIYLKIAQALGAGEDAAKVAKTTAIGRAR